MKNTVGGKASCL